MLTFYELRLLSLEVIVQCTVAVTVVYPFLIQIERKLVLLSVLKEPVSRSIFDYALRSKDSASLFRHLHMLQKKRNGSLHTRFALDLLTFFLTLSLVPVDG